MHKLRTYFPYSIVSVCYGAVATLGTVYIGLIAVVMSYAALTVEFSQSVRNDEASIAALEARYLATVAEITSTDYTIAGYAKPVSLSYVSKQGPTALR
jgi:hypothetical protein